jgi:hypothetical protein
LQHWSQRSPARVSRHAADDSRDKAAKKTVDGFGNLLRHGPGDQKTGIGDEGKKQESKETKKDDKKPSAAANPKDASNAARGGKPSSTGE